MSVALLDANVLWSAPVRDVLLRVAELGRFRPSWTSQILDEFSQSLQRLRPDLSPQQISGLIAQLNFAFPESLITSYEHLIPSMTNDFGDRHVLAAAAAGRVDTVLTFNLSHFPPEDCERVGVHVESPDQFLMRLCEVNPHEILRSLERQASFLKNPPVSTAQLLAHLERQLPAFAIAMRGLFDP
jgi:PIN domain